MIQPSLLIYDDTCGRWGPLCDTRPLWAARSGILCAWQRIERALGRRADAFHVPPRLAAVTQLRFPDRRVNPDRFDGRWITVNSRWIGLGDPPPGAVSELEGREIPHLLCRPADICGPGVIERPWHILDQLEKTLAADLAVWTGPRVAASASIHPSAIIDESHGPVVIDEHATLEPLAVVQGPAYVGPHTIIRAHADIRPNTVIGPHCRVGGEVSFSVIHGYSNKSHLGFLGHALVGQWVNLGAGTNASNLKNTYGPVQVCLASNSPPEQTGRTFLGPLIGDFVRTGIGTRINTGCIIGTGAMIAASKFTPAAVPPFAFLTDKGERKCDIEKFLVTARTMMARREVEMTGEEGALLRDLAGH